MHVVIEQNDFRRLSQETQREVLEVLIGHPIEPPARPKTLRARWRVPIDLTDELCARLLHGLSETHRERLALFAKNGGRATMRELMEVGGDTDPRTLSHFEGAVTRRLRRIMGDTEKKAHLIGWDYESTQWNSDQTQIVDGEYYVSPHSAKVLQKFFEAA